MTEKIKFDAKKIIIFLVYVTLFCVYIFPTGIVDTNAVISKTIFLAASSVLYIVYFKKISAFDWIFLLLILLLTIYTKKFNFLTFFALPACKFVVMEKESVEKALLKSNILYICLAFTILYTIIFFGTDGKYAFSAIKEINQSGLAIYCLGLMLMKKNKKFGIFTLLLGMLTFSRSYLLAIVIYIFCKLKLVKSLLQRIKVNKISYLFLTVLNTVIFVGLAFLYIKIYKTGDIGMNDKLYKFINPFDYSNLFRFTAILYTILIVIHNPKYLLFGMDEIQYNSLCQNYAINYSVPFRPTDPHNLLFSHVKMYGFVGIIETIYVSYILKKIVTSENFHIFLSITLYSLILGAGLYSYWLYLSIFALIMHSDVEKVSE